MNAPRGFIGKLSRQATWKGPPVEVRLLRCSRPARGKDIASERGGRVRYPAAARRIGQVRSRGSLSVLLAAAPLRTPHPQTERFPMKYRRIYRLPLPASSKLVLTAMNAEADEAGDLKAFVGQVAAWCGLEPRTARKAITKLVELGYVIVLYAKGGNARPNEYRVVRTLIDEDSDV